MCVGVGLFEGNPLNVYVARRARLSENYKVAGKVVLIMFVLYDTFGTCSVQNKLFTIASISLYFT